MAEELKSYSYLVDAFKKEYPSSGNPFVVKVPSRINLKGVHIEHRGGYVNYMAIDRNAVFAVSARDDDRVEIKNINNEKFSQRSFSISEELPAGKRGDWIQYLQDVKLVRGDWVNYFKAGVLILQDKFKDKQFRGMNVLVDSDIPIGAGLSSSSAMVVGAAMAACKINRLDVSREELVELCGKGEWYVGTRGGAGDHAAMIFGKKNYIMHMQFFPLRVEYVPFPEGYKVVMCNSFVEASKSRGAKSRFNERVATYGIAMLYIKKLFPEKAGRFEHLRDVSLEDEKWIYGMLKLLPVKINRDELLRELPENAPKLEKLFQSHDAPEAGYRVRDVCLFGLSECKRGELFIDLLKDSDMESIGRFMCTSQDGDRAVKFDSSGNKKEWVNQVSDEKLDSLVEKAGKKKHTYMDDSALCMQPGGYACSCEELDFIVDLAGSVPGVVGANLTGAGLGGCVLALVKNENVKNLIEVLEEKYYKAKGLPSGCEVCQPGDGASIL